VNSCNDKIIQNAGNCPLKCIKDAEPGAKKLNLIRHRYKNNFSPAAVSS